MAAVVVDGIKNDHRMTIRWDATMPSLYLLYRQGESRSPIAWATARMAALFVKHFPCRLTGVHAPEALPQEVRRAILRDARARGFRITRRVAAHRPSKRS